MRINDYRDDIHTHTRAKIDVVPICTCPIELYFHFFAVAFFVEAFFAVFFVVLLRGAGFFPDAAALVLVVVGFELAADGAAVAPAAAVVDGFGFEAAVFFVLALPDDAFFFGLFALAPAAFGLAVAVAFFGFAEAVFGFLAFVAVFFFAGDFDDVRFAAVFLAAPAAFFGDAERLRFLAALVAAVVAAAAAAPPAVAAAVVDDLALLGDRFFLVPPAAAVFLLAPFDELRGRARDLLLVDRFFLLPPAVFEDFPFFFCCRSRLCTQTKTATCTCTFCLF